jgi:hypothetical protein
MPCSHGIRGGPEASGKPIAATAPLPADISVVSVLPNSRSCALRRVSVFLNQVIDEITIKPEVSSILVKAEIEAALKRRARTDAQKISVDVQRSDVTLTGAVHSGSERDLARESAWSTPGVRNVVGKMTVSY